MNTFIKYWVKYSRAVEEYNKNIRLEFQKAQKRGAIILYMPHPSFMLHQRDFVNFMDYIVTGRLK